MKYTITPQGKAVLAKGTNLVRGIQHIIRDGDLSVAEVAKVLDIPPKMAKIGINMLAAQGYIRKKRTR